MTSRINAAAPAMNQPEDTKFLALSRLYLSSERVTVSCATRSTVQTSVPERDTEYSPSFVPFSTGAVMVRSSLRRLSSTFTFSLSLAVSRLRSHMQL